MVDSEPQSLRERIRAAVGDPSTAGAPNLGAVPGIAYLRAWERGDVAPLPVHERLGIAVAAIAEGRVVLTWDPDVDHYNPLGIVHGGATATLCDPLMGCAVLSTLPAGVAMTTRDPAVRYTRPITLATGQLRCEGWPIRAGGRAATAEARVTDGAGRVHASATSTYLILR